MSPRPKGDLGDDSEKPGTRRGDFNLSPEEGTNFDLTHKHSGLHGDGQKVQATNLDTLNPFSVDSEPVYTPTNASTSGRKYRIQIIEVTDPDTQQISAVIQVNPVT